MTEKGYRMATLTGNKLADLLKERGMSQKELAEAACLTPASVSRYVNGEREPRALTVAALADVLGVKPSDIIGTSDEQEMDTAVSFIVLSSVTLISSLKPSVPNSSLHSQSFRKYPFRSRRTYMYRCNDDTYDTLEKLTGGGELSDHSDQRMFR